MTKGFIPSAAAYDIKIGQMKGGAASLFQIFRFENAFGVRTEGVLFFVLIFACLSFEPSAVCFPTYFILMVVTVVASLFCYSEGDTGIKHGRGQT